MNDKSLKSPEEKNPAYLGFLIMPNFSMIAFASAIETLRLANTNMGIDIYKWQIITPTDDVVKASNGIEFTPDTSLKDVDNYDMLFICGGNRIQEFWTESIGKWLRLQDSKGIALGSFCTGAYILGKAGLLNNYRCTMHWDYIAATREEFPHLELTDHIYEIDRNRFTCAGGTASIDLMNHLVTLQHGRRLASAVSENFLVDYVRDMDNPQRVPLRLRIGTSQPKLVEAVRLMESNLEECLSAKELSDYVGLSKRQLERGFLKYLDRSPMEYYLDLRLRKARRLLLQTDNSIMDISISCGFNTQATFTSTYKKMFNMTPSKERHMIFEYDS